MRRLEGHSRSLMPTEVRVDIFMWNKLSGFDSFCSRLQIGRYDHKLTKVARHTALRQEPNSKQYPQTNGFTPPPPHFHQLIIFQFEKPSQIKCVRLNCCLLTKHVALVQSPRGQKYFQGSNHQQVMNMFEFSKSEARFSKRHKCNPKFHLWTFVELVLNHRI